MRYKHVNLKLHLKFRTLAPAHPQFRSLSSTFSGSKDALLDVTVFSANENKLPDFELTAGNGKTTLVFKLLLSEIN